MIAAEPNKSWLVWKFGGTSLADTARFVNVANLICQNIPRIQSTSSLEQTDISRKHGASFESCLQTGKSHFGCDYETSLSSLPKSYRLAVIVSAMAGTTDALNEVCNEASEEFSKNKKKTQAARRGIDRARTCSESLPVVDTCSDFGSLKALKDTHFKTVEELVLLNELDEADGAAFKDLFLLDLSYIKGILRAFSISGYTPSSLREVVLGFGELWSSRILFGILKKRDSLTDNQEDLADSIRSSGSSDLNSVETECSAACVYCTPCPVHGSPAFSPCCSSKAVRWLDARQVITVDESTSGADGLTFERIHVDFELSQSLLDNWLSIHHKCEVVVATGYICSLRSGCPTTLRRNGSDYSGSIFAALLKAKLYTVWTDVEGIFTADPRKVPTAFRLPFLSYIEAIELAYFGAKVLHPLTMEPCITNNIPIVLRSSLCPSTPGTLIGACLPATPPLQPLKADTRALIPPTDTLRLSPSISALTAMPSKERRRTTLGRCRAFTLIDNIALISVSGTSLIGVPGIASRVFGAVHEARCSVIMISQASSEHSICFAVLSPSSKTACEAVESAFYKEVQHDRSMSVFITDHCSIICAVGERMCGALGVLGELSSALAHAKVNVKAVTQGSTELNITFVVETCQSSRALRAMHDAIYGVDDISSIADTIDSQITTSKFRLIILIDELNSETADSLSYLFYSNGTLGRFKNYFSLYGFTNGLHFTLANLTFSNVRPVASLFEDMKEDSKSMVLIDLTGDFPDRNIVAESFRKDWTCSGRFILRRTGVQVSSCFKPLMDILTRAY